jgi:hypothetical protein
VKLDDSSSGIAPDTREGTSLRTSATTGPGRNLEEAMTTALTSLVRQADLRFADLDATSIATATKLMRVPGSDMNISLGDARVTVFLVIATGTAYARPAGTAKTDPWSFDG